jgi:hypothetical protein
VHDEPEPDVLSFLSTFVWSGMEPLRLVVHDHEGGWQFLCTTTTDAAFLLTIHAEHVFERFASDLDELADLPPGYQAWRECPSDAWTVEEADEDDEAAD